MEENKTNETLTTGEDYSYLDKIHYAMKLLLAEVDRICKACDIQYVVSDGTFLGAVRHKNFIPWDDDVDVAFTRENFEKFLQVAPQMLAPHFQLVLPGEDGKFFDMSPKINYINSQIHAPCEDDDFYNGKHNKLSLDLFCLEPPCEGIFGKIQKLRLQQVYGYAMGHRRTLDMAKYQGFAKFSVAVFSFVGKFLPMKYIIKRFYGAARWGKSKEFYFLPNEGILLLKLRERQEWFRETAKYEIGGDFYSGVKDYDAYLKNLYKNYMTPPPVEKRYPVHSGNISDIKVYDLEGNELK